MPRDSQSRKRLAIGLAVALVVAIAIAVGIAVGVTGAGAAHGACSSHLHTAADGSCVACTGAGHCGSHRVCSPTGTCVACTSDAHCSSGYVCGPTGTCSAACTVHADCGPPSGVAPLVVPANAPGVTTACADDGDCTWSSDRPHCVATGDNAGLCAECADDGDCATGKVCDPDHSACVACVTAADCDPDKACYRGACVAPFSAATPACAAHGGCSECTADQHCPAGTFCATATSTCVQCTHDAHCAGKSSAHMACTSTGLCLPACTTNADCPAATPTCHDGACRATTPLGVVALEGAEGYADAEGLGATPCVADSHCAGHLEVCGPAGRCQALGESPFTLRAVQGGGAFSVLMAAQDGGLTLETAATTTLRPSVFVVTASTTADGTGFALFGSDTGGTPSIVLKAGPTAVAGAPAATYAPISTAAHPWVLKGEGGVNLAVVPTPGQRVAFSLGGRGSYLTPDFDGRSVVLGDLPYYWTLGQPW